MICHYPSGNQVVTFKIIWIEYKYKEKALKDDDDQFHMKQGASVYKKILKSHVHLQK